jgi:hypothetical protein
VDETEDVLRQDGHWMETNEDPSFQEEITLLSSDFSDFEPSDAGDAGQDFVAFEQGDADDIGQDGGTDDL